LEKVLAENADRDVYLRHAGMTSLLRCASPEQIAGLKSNASASVRLMAVVALRRLASPALADFPSDADPRVSDEGIRPISEAPIPAARPALNAMLDAYVGAAAPRPLPPMTARRHPQRRDRGSIRRQRRHRCLVGQEVGYPIRHPGDFGDASDGSPVDTRRNPPKPATTLPFRPCSPQHPRSSRRSQNPFSPPSNSDGQPPGNSTFDK